MITQNYDLSRLNLPWRAAGGTCTRTAYLTKKVFLCMNFGGMQLPGQEYLIKALKNKQGGQIDDTRIFNYALTAVQVRQVYNEGFGTRFGPTSGTS